MSTRLLSIFALLALLLVAGGDVYASERRVPRDFASIQAAIDNAVAGDTVTVGAGLYKENIIIDKHLTLRADGGNAGATIEAADKAAPTVKVIGAAGVSIEGFTMRGSDVSGLEVEDTEGAVLSGNLITGNFNGIFISNSTGAVISGNTIEENIQYGVYFKDSDSNRLEDNTVRSNADKGIYITFSDENVITLNRSYLNRWDGLLLWTSNRNIIKKNKVLRNTYAIIITESEGNTVEGNSTWPNIILILPALLIYVGIMLYIVQKYAIARLLKS